MLPPCTCMATPTNPHAAVKRDDGLPAHCTERDPCGVCGETGCAACGFRGYSQHCERVYVDGVVRPGWSVTG